MNGIIAQAGLDVVARGLVAPFRPLALAAAIVLGSILAGAVIVELIRWGNRLRDVNAPEPPRVEEL